MVSVSAHFTQTCNPICRGSPLTIDTVINLEREKDGLQGSIYWGGGELPIGLESFMATKYFLARLESCVTTRILRLH